MIIQLAIKEFLLYCQFQKNLSKKTLKAYTTDLKQLSSFLNSKQFIAEITKQDIQDYLIYISKLKPKSIKRKIATAKALFNFMEFEDKISINLFRKMRIQIKEPQRLPSVLDMQEVIKIFKIVYDKKTCIEDENSYSFKEAARNIAVIELLFTTGARVSEIANLKKEYINLNSGTITVCGKGNKERIIQICNNETINSLKNYYELFKGQIGIDGWFLINRCKNKLSDQSIRNLVRNVAGDAGLSRHITPHVFRHSFATLLLERDVDIKYIQILLGHSSILTTQIYTHVNSAKQKQILQTKHPRKDFNCNKIVNKG